MTDAYPIRGGGYQPKSADERKQVVATADDPVTVVLNEISAILLDRQVQRWLVQQGSVPTTLLLPWLQELYARGVVTPNPSQGEPTT